VSEDREPRLVAVSLAVPQFTVETIGLFVPDGSAIDRMLLISKVLLLVPFYGYVIRQILRHIANCRAA
jgi:hypothetical protein